MPSKPKSYNLQPMIRITTGSAKNKKLKIPEVEGFRGVQEVAKMALFSILGSKVEGTSCLDLYAGSGNLGLEALSRGALHCDFVDENYEAIGCINENIKNCGFSDKAAVHKKDCVKFVSQTGDKYDLIFADPFYNNTTHVHLLKNIEGILKEGGILAFFHGKDLDFGELAGKTNLIVLTTRNFGASVLEILEKPLI